MRARRRKRGVAVVLALAAAALAVTSAFADTLQLDTDDAFPPETQSLNLGQLCPEETASGDVDLYLRRTQAAGTNNVFNEGATVDITAAAVDTTNAGGATVSGSSSQTVLPGDWPSQASDGSVVHTDGTSTAQVIAGTSLGLRSAVLRYTATGAGDGGGTATKTRDLTINWEVVTCNEPPDVSGAYPSIETIWPPNHKLVSVGILGVTDPDGDTVTITVDTIHQDEVVNGLGDGTTASDGFGVGTNTAEVRAERSGTGNGRVYTICFTADDGNGGTSSGCVEVSVPHSKGANGAAVNDGALYDSTAP